MEIKNMQYWKRKATLPGLNYESENKLPSGLAKSSALQKNEEKEAKKSSMSESKKAVKRTVFTKDDPTAPPTRLPLIKNKPTTRDIDPVKAELIKKYNLKSRSQTVKAKSKKSE